jgi:hypothetical protein
MLPASSELLVNTRTSQLLHLTAMGMPGSVHMNLGNVGGACSLLFCVTSKEQR